MIVTVVAMHHSLRRTCCHAVLALLCSCPTVLPLPHPIPSHSRPCTSHPQGFVAGTVDAATGALLSRQPRPTRVKRGILQCTAQDLLGQALAAEARLREARDDGRRLQALVDSAHQAREWG